MSALYLSLGFLLFQLLLHLYQAHLDKKYMDCKNMLSRNVVLKSLAWLEEEKQRYIVLTPFSQVLHFERLKWPKGRHQKKTCFRTCRAWCVEVLKD